MNLHAIEAAKSHEIHVARLQYDLRERQYAPGSETWAMNELHNEGFTVERLADLMSLASKAVKWRLQTSKACERVLDLADHRLINMDTCYVLSKMTIEQQHEIIELVETEEPLPREVYTVVKQMQKASA